MSVSRLNLSHGSWDDHNHYVRIIRQAAQEMGVAVGILADLPGPKYRVGEMTKREIILSTGQRFLLQSEPCKGTAERANVWPLGLPQDLKKGVLVRLNNDVCFTEEHGGKLRYPLTNPHPKEILPEYYPRGKSLHEKNNFLEAAGNLA